MNIKKLFAVLAGVSMLATQLIPAGALAATYSQELQDAYNWAYSKSITTMSSIDNANMYGAITRAELAKMLANWAKDKGQTPDTSKACSFTDTASVQGDLATAIVEACQLGLMGQGITAFRPYDTISRAEFGTALSRALWGSQYEGGNPYYVNHLNALKAAGIMTQIANAESTKEVRGYVMLMLMRSEGAEGSSASSDCDDPLVVIACAAESDACPAACREGAKEDENSDEAPKSGSLVVTANSADGKVFIGRASELDVLTFRTSEEVEISKVVLERYGYSTSTNVAYVWLENEEGAVITNKATLDSKGQAKLTLKKDYKKVDGELNATIVLQTSQWANLPYAWLTVTNPGATFGFKVIDVTSSAEDVDLDNYKPATYEAIAYDGSVLNIISRAANKKTYNFEAGNMYEVAKFKIQSPDDSAVKVNWFTLENVEVAATRLDLRKYFDKAEITIDGQAVSKLNAEANKSDELVFSFKDVEIAAKSKAEVVVKISLAEDFDTFNRAVELSLTEINAVDSKVASRVTVWHNGALLWAYATTDYQFNGGKIKLTNNKLGNVDAAQNSEDVLVAEGTITVPETVKGSFYIDVNGDAAGAVKSLTFVVNGDETDGVPYDLTTATAFSTTAAYEAGDIVVEAGLYYVAKSDVAAAANVAANAAKWTNVTIPAVAGPWVATDFVRYYFNNIEIEKSGKIRFLVDIRDSAAWNNNSIKLSNFGFEAFDGLVYDESNNPVGADEVSGTISFSKVTIQPAKASMSNSTSKEVEFMNKETDRKVVFDGTYTAKKWDVQLNEFAVYSAYNLTTNGNKVTFYVYVDWEEVADAKVPTTADTAGTYAGMYVARDTFDKVLVKDGESVSVKVEAEVEAIATETIGKYDVDIRGEDVNGNTPSGLANAKTVSIKVVDKGSVNVSTSASRQTIIKKASDAVIAQFTVKPANGASSIDLEEIEFTLTADTAILDANAITLKVADIEEDDVTVDAPGKATTRTYTYSMNRNIPAEWVSVLVTLDDEYAGTVALNNLLVNEKKQTKTFSKMFVEAAVWVEKQSSSEWTTTYLLGVEKDSDVDVRNFTVYFNNGSAQAKALEKEFDDGDKLSVNGTNDRVDNIYWVSYEYTNGYVYTDTNDDGIDASDTCLNGTTPLAGWTAWTDWADKCEWSIIKIRQSSTAVAPAGWVVMPDYFKIGENEEDLKVFKL